MNELNKVHINKKLHIEALRNGKSEGFVKQINYENGEVHLTSDSDLSHTYCSEDEAHSDIDFLTKVYFESGYTFIY